MPGITRRLTIKYCRILSIPCREENLSLTQFYTADAVFATGTMGELTPVAEIDGRLIDFAKGRAVFEKIRDQFHRLMVISVW